MKILRSVEKGHNCIEEIRALLEARGLGAGTVVECDCDLVWLCEELHERGGMWKQLVPSEVLRVEEERWRG